jgi:hypothetical protein
MPDAYVIESAAGPRGEDALRVDVHAREPVEASTRRRWRVSPGRAYCLSIPVRTALDNAFGQIRILWLATDRSVLRSDVSGATFLMHDFAPLRVWALAPEKAAPAAFQSIGARAVVRLRRPARHARPRLGLTKASGLD